VPRNKRYQPVNEAGQDLDAQFEIEGQSFDVILLSKNGEGRNPDYKKGLESVLRQLSKSGGELLQVLLDSKPAVDNFAEEDRVVPVGCPIPLNSATDVAALTNLISREQSSVCQTPGAKGGNSHRRIRLRIHAFGATSQSELLQVLRP